MPRARILSYMRISVAFHLFRTLVTLKKKNRWNNFHDSLCADPGEIRTAVPKVAFIETCWLKIKPLSCEINILFHFVLNCVLSCMSSVCMCI